VIHALEPIMAICVEG